MIIRAYSPQTGNLLSESIDGINYGNIRQGEHCVSPVLIQPVKTTEEEFDQMAMYLQNNAGYNQSHFGFRKSSDFTSDVRSYTSDGYTGPIISDHFTLCSDASDTEKSKNVTPGDFVWLDVEVGATETGSTNNVNYRFVFEYN